MCLGWSVMRSRVCGGCKSWMKKHPERGVCARCRNDAHLSAESLCKPCLQAIRIEDDAQWALQLPGAPPRHLQLLIGVGRDYATMARPLRRDTGDGSRVGEDWQRKLRQRQHQDPQPLVLQPQLWGQIPLFTVPRWLTDATVKALVARPVSGWERARAALVHMTVEHGMAKGWQAKVAEMVRLALAVREAEGAELLPEPLLRDLPTNGDAVRLVLLQAELLDPAPQPMRFSRTDQPNTPYITTPVPIPPRPPRSCRDCDAWMLGNQRGFRCSSCRHWRESHAIGQCSRCRRDDLALRAERCRTCHPYRLLDAAYASTARATQLQLDLPAGLLGPVTPISVDVEASEPDDATPALLACQGQQALFGIRRDWAPMLARIRGQRRADLPLTAAAQHLVDEFTELRRNRQVPDYRKNLHTLIVTLHWVGIDTPISERDIHDLAQLDPNLAAKPVCQFLRARGLLIEDPELHQDAHHTWIDTTIDALPDQVASEIRTWVTVSRGQDDRLAASRSYHGIRRYLTALHPTLVAWTQTGVTSLREISRNDIEQAVGPLSGHARRTLATCLRSLFKTLKRERVIFRDPTRYLPVGDLKAIPRAVPSDVLAGLLSSARTPLARLVIAFVAVHALGGNEMRSILATDLNLSRGTLTIRRGLPHTVHLEGLTRQLITDWLNYRHERWPASTNPHLLVSQKTALDPDHPAISLGTLRANLPTGVTLDGLRQDRILNEALETTDPLRLMRLFGISDQTAMRYVGAAHPERTSKLPR